MDNLPVAIQNLIVDFLTFLPKFFAAIVILIIAIYVAAMADRLVRKALALRGASSQITHLLAQLARWTILALGVVTALQQVNFDVTGLVAGLGIVGFTLGFALQDIAANFISGVILLVQQPFQPGDLIETGGYTGRVKAVDLRTTLIQTPAGEDVLIPNGTVLSSAIKNITKTPTQRVEVTVGVAYQSDLEQVRTVALNAMKGIPGEVADKSPVVCFHTFGASSIDLTVYFWVNLNELGLLDAKDVGVTRIKAAFDQAGIEIPYPIHTIYLQQG